MGFCYGGTCGLVLPGIEMALPSTFTGNVTPTGEELDANFNALGALTPIPCSVSGTNAITLTPEANTPTVSAYANYAQFTGVAAGTNTTTVTAQVGAIPALTVYKDTIAGPVALSGSEIVQNTKLILMYDSTLNSGAGGFHLISPPSATTRNHTTTASIGLASLAPQTGESTTILLGGTSVGDIVNIGFPSLVSIGLTWNGYVNNAGTVTLNAFNMTSGSVTPNAGIYRINVTGYS
jgi:hypothetical protein